MHRSFAGILLALTSATLYGITPFFVNVAYDNGADPYGLMTARYAVASAILLVIRLIRVGRYNWPVRRVAVQLFLLGAIGLYLNSVFVFNALKRMDSGLAMALFFFYPVVVVLLGWLLYRHKPDRIVWACLITTICGVVLGASDVSGGEVLGVVFIVSGAVVYAIYSVIGAHIMPRTDVLSGLWFVLTGAAFSFVAVWAIDPPGMPSTLPWTPPVLWSALEIAVIGTIVGMMAFFAGMNRIGAAKSAIVQTFEVLVTVTMGLLFLSESLTARQVVGAALILGSVILLTRSEARRVDDDHSAPSLEGHIAL
jgi:drug/metabolite transporter (DMT)-like permease